MDFHPAYHQLMATAFGAGVHTLPWAAQNPGGHIARAVLSYLWDQVDGGTACPTGMTYAAIPLLAAQPGLSMWAHKASALSYDATFAPLQDKTAAHIGLAMTEK